MPQAVNYTPGRNSKMNQILKGREAIVYAIAHELRVNKYADPTEEAIEGLNSYEADRIMREDPSLIWIEATNQEGRYQVRPLGEDGPVLFASNDAAAAKSVAGELGPGLYYGVEILDTVTGAVDTGE